MSIDRDSDIRQWVSFEDPEENRTWVFDVTFMASSWHCIYGSGCKGILETPDASSDHGCCSHGAHFSGDEDRKRVAKFAKGLGKGDWQFKAEAQQMGGAIGKNEDGEVVTKTHEGACIFLNRKGFPGGSGCALHSYALRNGINPIDAKPDVCWQLPLRREDTRDALGKVTSTITQWDRRHWGEGGEDFGWWCTESPEAFGGNKVPVYETLKNELIGLSNSHVYSMLSEYMTSQAGRSRLIPHQAIRRKHNNRP